MSSIMQEMVERLLRNKEGGENKAYFIGLERGRIWASGDADYFEMKEWSGVRDDEFDDLVLPPTEKLHYEVLSAESQLEWKAYLRGWLDGVREVSESY